MAICKQTGTFAVYDCLHGQNQLKLWEMEVLRGTTSWQSLSQIRSCKQAQRPFVYKWRFGCLHLFTWTESAETLGDGSTPEYYKLTEFQLATANGLAVSAVWRLSSLVGKMHQVSRIAARLWAQDLRKTKKLFFPDWGSQALDIGAGMFPGTLKAPGSQFPLTNWLSEM